MAIASDAPQGGFRLSQLLYDTRYRSITIQTIALILLGTAIWWLINNTAQNLAALGKEFDLDFLGQPAQYDINQRLIEYDSQRTHGRAAIVGMLNTILVAIIGCIAATIIGTIAGVLRLSKNWIVSRLMAIYVEGFRNVPLLLWIVLIFAVVNESFPHPRDFRTGGGEEMVLFDTTALTRQGVFTAGPAFNGYTLILAVVFIGSLVANSLWRRHVRKVQAETGRLLPVFWPSMALLFVPVTLAHFVVSAVSADTPRAIVAVTQTPGQDIATFTEEANGPTLCHYLTSTSAENLRRFLGESGVRFRSNVYVSRGGAERAMALGNCDMITAAPDEAEALSDRLLDTRLAIFDTRLTRDLAALDDRLAENREVMNRIEGEIARADTDERRAALEAELAVFSERLDRIAVDRQNAIDAAAEARSAIRAPTLNVLSDQTTLGNALDATVPQMTESGIARFEGGMQVRNSMIALWLALSLYTGAFIAEIVRGGILAISKGQTEASYALGLRPGRTMNLVILPQAMRVIIPPLISQFLNLTKNTSLAIAVGYMDVRATLGGITINQTGKELEGMLLLGLFYLLLSLLISMGMNIYNMRVKLKER